MMDDLGTLLRHSLNGTNAKKEPHRLETFGEVRD